MGEVLQVPIRVGPGVDDVPAMDHDQFSGAVLRWLDGIAREFRNREVVALCDARSIRVAIAGALGLRNPRAFDPEIGQAIAFDWAHPDAREFQHALIGMSCDWDVGPAATKSHRFPGGASVSANRS